ncbi:uncharacterized protein LOC114286274 [Camellia sinensis]|uniref:uncharacterized protein LOC114286274 n=1 Tax=Camellia sinensis TaxID=4442 RepID=UPI001036B648|nr:uncharacterized protein LOC114286274 [Camellia sinensis]
MLSLAASNFKFSVLTLSPTVKLQISGALYGLGRFITWICWIIFCLSYLMQRTMLFFLMARRYFILLVDINELGNLSVMTPMTMSCWFLGFSLWPVSNLYNGWRREVKAPPKLQNLFKNLHMTLKFG